MQLVCQSHCRLEAHFLFQRTHSGPWGPHGVCLTGHLCEHYQPCRFVGMATISFSMSLPWFLGGFRCQFWVAALVYTRLYFRYDCFCGRFPRYVLNRTRASVGLVHFSAANGDVLFLSCLILVHLWELRFRFGSCFQSFLVSPIMLSPQYGLLELRTFAKLFGNLII